MNHANFALDLRLECEGAEHRKLTLAANFERVAPTYPSLAAGIVAN